MYPVMLDVTDLDCLVVGGGGVAWRKAHGLLEDGARVRVVAPEVVEPLRAMADRGRIELVERAYQGGEAGGYALVFAATDDPEVNQQVVGDARAAGRWVNVADEPELCSFHLPARVRRGSMQLALGSAGEAPFAIRRLRELLERRFGPEWSEWLDAAARFRAAVLSGGAPRDLREAAYDRFFSGTVDADTLRARVPTEAEESEWLGVAADHRVPPAPRAGASSVCAEEGGGFVSLIGAGPGCPGLLTVRGRQRLLEADAVVYERLAAPALPAELDARVELHCVGKTAGNHPVPQEEINALIVRLARSGRRVARLKGGDPFVFGRGGEEAEDLVVAGIPFEIVPGVTSGVAAPAFIGVPVTHRREAVRVTLLTAHEAIKSEGPQVRWDLLAQDRHATIVGYMGLSALPGIAARLIDAGMDPATPAAVIEQGTTAAQRHVVATLGTLVDATQAAHLAPPALFVIGPTVAHADRLAWFDRQPLAGQRLLIAETGDELPTRLERAGADVVAVPVPLTPAARVVMAALPLTGCVVRNRAEVDLLDEDRETVVWTDDAAMWCVDEDGARRARERGWRRVELLGEGLSCVELAARLAH